ncbi:DUF3617 domain-containing protein [Phenylobacterium deserti]|nr:DUF3617 family protein [Phenylobacterium deserti]
MKNLTALLLAAAAIATPAAAAQKTETIKPGYWESTNRLLSPIRDSSTEKRCITPADVEKFMNGPSNRHYACTYPTKVIDDGKITLKGTCVSKKGRKVAVEGEGSYTPTSFQINARIASELFGIPLSGRASTEARRISDTCPPTTASSGK